MGYILDESPVYCKDREATIHTRTRTSGQFSWPISRTYMSLDLGMKPDQERTHTRENMQAQWQEHPRLRNQVWDCLPACGISEL